MATRGLSVRTSRRSPAPLPGQTSATPVTSQDPPTLPQPEQLSQHDALLSPQIMEALITRVADEVSLRLSPAENPASLPPTVPSALQEVPVTTVIHLLQLLMPSQRLLLKEVWELLLLP